MALIDKFTATSVFNGRQFHYERVGGDRYREELVIQEGTTYRNVTKYFTETQIQDELIRGHLVITNPVTMDSKYETPELPATFYFTNSRGLRYTGYIQDDLVTVAWGSGVATETHQYTLSAVKHQIEVGTWIVLPESYRNRHTVVSEFMQFMETHQGPLTIEDRVAMAETIVVLNKIMYD